MTDNSYNVFVAVDTQVLYHSCRFAFGERAKIDYKKLKDLIQRNIGKLSGNPNIEAIAYTVATSREVDTTPFIGMLRSLNFVTRTKKVPYTHRNANNQFRMEWSVGITIDVMNRVLAEHDPIDRLVLVSGVGSYAELVDCLDDYRVPTDVYGFRGSVATMLEESAEELYYLTEDILFDPASYGSANREYEDEEAERCVDSRSS